MIEAKFMKYRETWKHSSSYNGYYRFYWTEQQELLLSLGGKSAAIWDYE